MRYHEGYSHGSYNHGGKFYSGINGKNFTTTLEEKIILPTDHSIYFFKLSIERPEHDPANDPNKFKC